MDHDKEMIEMKAKDRSEGRWMFPEMLTLSQRIGVWRDGKGFKTDQTNVLEKLLLIHCEVSEAVEEYRDDGHGFSY